MVRKAQILMMDLLEKNVGMQSRFLRPNVAKAKIRIEKKMIHLMYVLISIH